MRTLKSKALLVSRTLLQNDELLFRPLTRPYVSNAPSGVVMAKARLFQLTPRLDLAFQV